jgi:His-Xaa-Ser system protein HxsD
MKSNFKIKDNTAIIKINKNIYPKEVLIQATYVKLDKFYFLIDEDENYYIVSMKYKEKNEKNNLEKAVFEFFDELIESQSYLDQLKRTSKIREIILERALLGQTLDDETLDSLAIEDKKENNFQPKS